MAEQTVDVSSFEDQIHRVEDVVFAIVFIQSFDDKTFSALETTERLRGFPVFEEVGKKQEESPSEELFEEEGQVKRVVLGND